MNNAIFAFRHEQLRTGRLLSGKLELFEKLRERDVQPYVSLGAESNFDTSGVEVHNLVDDDATKYMGHLSLSEVGVIVNRLDRSVKLDALPTTWQRSMPPLINENLMRSLVYRKDRVQAEVLSPLDLGMPTRVIENIFDIDSFTTNNPSEYYIIKPISGTFSRNVHRLKLEDIANHVMATGSFGKVIIQPAYDFSVALPNYLRPYDKASRQGFEELNVAGITKELRMYAFHSPESTTVFPVARAIKDGVDNWFFVDPQSLPEELIDGTKRVIGKAAHLTGSLAIYAALDFGYGSINHNNPGYHIIELNGHMPYLIGYDKNPGVADRLRNHFADQIQQTVNHKPA